MSFSPSSSKSWTTFTVPAKWISVVINTTFLTFFSSKNFKNSFLSLVKVKLFEELFVAQLLHAVESKHSGIATGIGLDIIFQVASDDKRPFFSQASCCLPYNVLLFCAVSSRLFKLL